MRKSVGSLILVLLIFNFSDAFAAQKNIDLDTFLAKVWTKYQKVTKEKEILDLQNRIANSAEAGRLSLYGQYDLENQDRDQYHDSETGTHLESIDNRKKVYGLIGYNKKVKHGPKIRVEGRYNKNQINTYENESVKLYSTELNLEVSQSLFKDLMQEFYTEEGNNISFDSEKQVETARENYVLFKAIQSYTEYLAQVYESEILQKNVDYVRQTIGFLEENSIGTGQKLKIYELKKELLSLAGAIKSNENDIISLKYYLMSLCGESMINDDMDFVDNSLDRKNLTDKYAKYINEIYRVEIENSELGIKAQELRIKETRNENNPDLNIFGETQIRSENKDPLRAGEFSKPDYKVGLSLSMHPFNTKNSLEVEKDRIVLKELKAKHEESIRERDNKLFVDKARLKVLDGEIEVTELEIENLLENLDLQKAFLSEVLTSDKLTPGEIMKEFYRFEDILQELKAKRFDMYNKKLSWVEKFYSKIKTYNYMRYIAHY